ncbi:hypothetical protein V8E36_004507 [Tilletia maclaganii]
MTAPRNSAFALSSLMSPAGPPRSSQKRKADEAGIESFSATLSLDALSAAAAAAATTVEQQIAAPHPSAALTVPPLDLKDAPLQRPNAQQQQIQPERDGYWNATAAPNPGAVFIMESNGDEGHYDDDGGIIRCICGCDDDDGFTVQCDRCLVWQHCACLKMTPDSLPDEYLCEQCFPRPVDVHFARDLQQRRKDEEARKELEEQQRKAMAARRVSAAHAVMASSIATLPEPQILPPPVPMVKDSRGRKPSQSENTAAGDVDYFSGPLTSASSAQTPAAAKAAKRKSGTGLPKSLKRNSTVTTPAAPAEVVTPAPLPTPKEPRPREREDDDVLDAQDRFAAWSIEYTPVPSNIYTDPQIRITLDAVADLKTQAPRLRAFEVGTGKVMVPLADPAEDDIDSGDPMQLMASPPQARDQGLAVVGNECVPVEIEAASLSDVTQRATVRYIPEGVAAGMFSQIHSSEFSPSTPRYAWSATHSIPRPTMHGLYADGAISAGTFITEFRGEISNADAYRADPINQYGALGTTKPHVHTFPPPLNIAIDARRYGTEARFARPSCHPNAVLRPIVLGPSGSKSTDSEPGDATAVSSHAESVPKREGTTPTEATPTGKTELLFGIFAISDINRGHEITLGWEWDDLHIVHFLPELVKEPPRVSRRAVSPVKDLVPEPITFPYAGTPVAAKMDAVTSAICSITLCACLGPASSNSSSAAAAAATYSNPTQLTQSNLRKQDCALAQMLRVAHGMELLQVIPSAKSHRKLRPPDFAPLIARRRWWRPLPLPPTPSDSISTEDGRRASRYGRALSPASVTHEDMEIVDDGSRRSGSDVEMDEDQRSEASSLTEPLSDSYDVTVAQEGAEDSSLSMPQNGPEATIAEEDDADRPTILPLKKRVAGTRLKATYFDGDFGSDDSEADSHDLLSKPGAAGRKQGTRMRTTSRSTRIVRDPRRRPLRSTPDLEDDSDAEAQTARSTQKSKQKRDAKLLAKMRKPNKDMQPSSPLSSLSSQASLSSLDLSDDDSGSDAEDSEQSSSGDSDQDSVSEGSGSNESDSEDGSSDGSTSDSSSGSSRHTKARLQERARKRTAKFRADIAALGDSDTSSEDSVVPAGQRKSIKGAGKASKRKAKPTAKEERKERRKKQKEDKQRAEKKVAKKSLPKSKQVRGDKLRKEGKERTTTKRDTEESLSKQKEGPKTAKAREGPALEHSSPSARARKQRPRQAIAASSSESDSDMQDRTVAAQKSLPTKASTLEQPLATRAPPVAESAPREQPHVEANLASEPALPTTQTQTAEPSTEAVVVKAEEAAALRQGPIAAVPAPEPPKTEPPRKKLSLADYKRRMAEKKTVEPVAEANVPEPSEQEQVPPVAASAASIAEDSKPQVIAEADVSMDADLSTPAVAPERTFDGFIAPLSPVKPRAPSPPASVAPSADVHMHYEHPDRRQPGPPRQSDRGWSRLSSPSRDEEIERYGSARQPSIDSVQRASVGSRWGDPPADPVRPPRPMPLTGSNAAPVDRDANGGSSLMKARPFGRVPAPLATEDRMDVDESPRYGGAIPYSEDVKPGASPTRPESGARTYPSLGSSWQAVSVERPRHMGRAPDAADHPRTGAGFRPAGNLAASPEHGRPELSIAGRAAAAGVLNRTSLGGPVPTGPAGFQPFNPPRGPRALMGSSIMAPPSTQSGNSAPNDTTALGTTSSSSATGSLAATPVASTSFAARLSGSNAISPTTSHGPGGSNKSGPAPGSSAAPGTGWTRISINTNTTAPAGPPSSTSSHITDRPSALGLPPPALRPDLMNFDGVPTGPASMRGESSGSSSYDDYEYFGGRDRGRGGWRGPRVRKRGGGRGRGWGMRS